MLQKAHRKLRHVWICTHRPFSFVSTTSFQWAAA